MFKNAMIYRANYSGEVNGSLQNFVFRDPTASKMVSAGLVSPLTLEPCADSLFEKVGSALVFAIRKDKISVPKAMVKRIVDEKLSDEGFNQDLDPKAYRRRKKELTEAVELQIASVKVNDKPIASSSVIYAALYDGKLIMSKANDEALLFIVTVLREALEGFSYELFLGHDVTQKLTNYATNQELYRKFVALGLTFGDDWKFECGSQKGALSGSAVDGLIPEAFFSDGYVIDKVTIFHSQSNKSIVAFKLDEKGYISSIKADFSNASLDDSDSEDSGAAGAADLLLTLDIINDIANTMLNVVSES